MIKISLKFLVLKVVIYKHLLEKTQYNLINDTLAKRTYDESGDYYVKPFEVFCKRVFE